MIPNSPYCLKLLTPNSQLSIVTLLKYVTKILKAKIKHFLNTFLIYVRLNKERDMGIDVGNEVKQSGITRNAFESQIKELDKETQESLRSIFDHYAGVNGQADLLDESEQVMARSAFAAMDNDQNNEVSKSEFKKGNGKAQFMNNKLKIVGKFFEVLDKLMPNDSNVESDSVNTDRGTILYDANGNMSTVLRGDGTVADYQNNGNKWTEVPKDTDITTPTPLKDPNSTPETPQPQPNKVNFENEEQIKSALIKHIMGMDVEGIEIPSDIKINLNNETGEATISFNGKEYLARKDNSGNIGFYSYNQDGSGSSLKYDISRSSSSDAANKLHNHGEINNSKSTYDAATGRINNTHGTQRAVSQTQTFASMLMNNNENSTLTLDAQKNADGTSIRLNGQKIIDTISGKENSDGVTINELIKYLKASAAESQSVQDKSGARKFAGNVDIDLKDMVNIGAVFQKYDENHDGKLNSTEMDSLLTALQNKSMTKITNENIIKEDGEIPPKGDSPEPSEKQKPEPQKEQISKDGKDWTRNVDRDPSNGLKPKAESNHKIRYHQDKNGLRTVYADQDGSSRDANTDGNIVMNEDHGLLGIGKKDFIFVQGLETQVDAEILHKSKLLGSENKDKLVIKVRDKNGNITYRAVNTNGKTYTLNNDIQLIQKGGNFITRQDAESDIINATGQTDLLIKIPKDMSIQYDSDGKHPQITYRGRVISKQVAQTVIQRFNSQQ